MVPVEVHDEVTGVLQGEDLRRERNKRRTEERLDRLEMKADEDRKIDKERDERLLKVEIGVDQLVAWKIEEREEKRLDRQFRAQTETNQVGLAKVKMSGRTRIIVAIISLITAAIGVLGTLAGTGHL